jgi:hypothetical protein
MGANANYAEDQVLLVIFGAGASYDSFGLRDGIHQPLPLAKDLVDRRFDEITQELPASRPVIDRLRERMEAGKPSSLEVELANFARSGNQSVVRRQQLMAFRYYLHRAIDGTTRDWLSYTGGFTHYVRLLNRIYDWHLDTGFPVLLATFNYDVLLDRAAEDVVTGWKLGRSLNSYVERDDFRLFKLHGSTDWSRVARQAIPANTSVVDAAMQMIGNDASPVTTIEPGTPFVLAGLDTQIRFPAMAIPLRDKTDFECPPDHVTLLRTLLSKVTNVLIVGWRAAEPHAVGLLDCDNESQAGLFPSYVLNVVTGSEKDVHELEENLGIVWRRGRVRVVETQGFSAFMARLDELLPQVLAPRF